MKITTPELEFLTAEYIGLRRNIIIPNVSWGFFMRREVDLLVITKARYLWEVELKVSKSDLRNDSKKAHGHRDDRIKRLYFCLPDYALDIDAVPERAGILVAKYSIEWKCWGIKELRPAKDNTSMPIDDSDYKRLLRLGILRVWSMKKKLNRRNNESHADGS